MSELKLIMPHTELLVFSFLTFPDLKSWGQHLTLLYLFFCNQFVILPFVVSHLLPPCFHITSSRVRLFPALLFPFFKKKHLDYNSLLISVLSRSHLAHRSWLILLKILHYSCYLWAQQYSMSNTPTCSQGLSLVGPTLIFLSLTPFIPFQSNHYLLLFGHNFLFLCLCLGNIPSLILFPLA